ncbi:hypothetical protein T265_12771, partial [Opisthorchis viverrini]
SLSICLEDRIKPFQQKINEFDAFVLRSNARQTDGPKSMTFVGNGHIGCSFEQEGLLVQHGGTMSKLLNIPVLISLDVHGYLSDASLVMDVRDGIMYKMNCFKHENELCVSSGTMVYAHRIYNSLLVQNFRVYNPLDDDATVKINKGNIHSWSGVRTLRTTNLKQQNLPGEEKPRTVSYQVLSILIEEPITEERSRGRSKETIVSHVTVVVLFEPVFPDMLTVHAGKTQSYSFITGVRSSTTPIPVTKADLTQAASDYGVIGRERKALESIVQSELAFALQYPEAELRTLHTTAWNRLWLSGITLSYSYAPNTLNGEEVNTTLYYLASHMPDYYSVSIDGNQTVMNAYLERANRRTTCSPPHNLLESTVHWQPVRSFSKMSNLISTWYSTLRLARCDAFFEDGAHGILQAALLHIGQFHLHEKYASCGLSAETLHRDILFRRVQLNQPGVYVNVEIRIVPGELSLSSPHLMVVELSTWRSDPPPPLSTVANSKTPNMLPMLSQPLDAALIAPIRPSADIQGNQRSDLLVWVEHEAQRIPVFVCPAGCQDMPVEVKKTRLMVPFLITIPFSVLMYFGTQDARTLMEYGQLFKYTDVHPGPNPDHDLITLHRHGHAFGGLPWLFWISLGLLITLFHLFFCKIIYNELVRDHSDDTENPSTYASHLRSPQALAARAYIKAQVASRRRSNRDWDTMP